MKIIKQSYEILSDISPFGIIELMGIEGAARVCYKSEDKITDQAESAKRLIKNLTKNGHEAMLEHSCLTVKFICDRGISHELVRHRMASFAQESTRYCNYSKDKFENSITVIEPLFAADMSDLHKMNIVMSDAETVNVDPFFSGNDVSYWYWHRSCFESERAYFRLLDLGLKPEEARSVLPMSLKTELVVTANYREWRHILKLRTAPYAHPQMRALMLPLLKELKERIPVIFDDIDVGEEE